MVTQEYTLLTCTLSSPQRMELTLLKNHGNCTQILHILTWRIPLRQVNKGEMQWLKYSDYSAKKSFRQKIPIKCFLMEMWWQLWELSVSKESTVWQDVLLKQLQHNLQPSRRLASLTASKEETPKHKRLLTSSLSKQEINPSSKTTPKNVTSP